MKTVRLPIYENGIELHEYLEVDTTFFLSSTAGLRSVQAQVVSEPREDSLLKSVIEFLELEEQKATIPVEVVEWRTLEALPVRSFEINKQGTIRHRATERVMQQEFDIDQRAWRTALVINGQTKSVDGKRVADAMWRDNP